MTLTLDFARELQGEGSRACAEKQALASQIS